jgi:hypothetical protein
MYDLTTPTFTYAGAMVPQQRGFTRAQHIAALLVGFAFSSIMGAAWLASL